jgi:hypothetical protein
MPKNRHANKTLPHVLNHCEPHLVALTHCHNVVLKWLVKAFMPPNGTNVQVNWAIPKLNDGLQLNLLISGVEKTTATIDVVMPFENHYPTFEAVGNKRRTKYDHIADQYWQAYSVFVDAFIVGVLGERDPANERIINWTTANSWDDWCAQA